MRISSTVLAIALFSAATGWTQTFPDKTKPLRMIVPSGAGSTGDLVARAYAVGITEVAGMPVVVENRPGAEGVIGVRAVKTAAPDGYTILFTSSSTQVLNVHMLPNISYDPIKDFVPLVGAGSVPVVMFLAAGLPYKTAKEFLEGARQNPTKYSFGSNTSATRLAAEMLERSAGVQLIPVLYKTLPEAFSSMAAGQVDIAFGTEASGKAFVQGGRIRIVASAGRTRLKSLPDVPTLQELGLRDYEVTSWFGTYAPAQTPPAITSALRDIIFRAGETKVVTNMANTFGIERMNLVGDALAAKQHAELDYWGKIVKPLAAQTK